MVKGADNESTPPGQVARSLMLGTLAVAGTKTETAKWPAESSVASGSGVPSFQDRLTGPAVFAHANRSPVTRTWSPRCPTVGSSNRAGDPGVSGVVTLVTSKG
jgi:hypothetical protein